jgi:hypothetical protein
MRQVGGKEDNVSLDLMQHSICVGHVTPVLHGRTPLFSDYVVNLFLNFG